MWVQMIPLVGIGFVVGVGATTAAWMFLELKNAPETEDTDYKAQPIYGNVEPCVKITEEEVDGDAPASESRHTYEYGYHIGYENGHDDGYLEAEKDHYDSMDRYNWHYLDDDPDDLPKWRELVVEAYVESDEGNRYVRMVYDSGCDVHTDENGVRVFEIRGWRSSHKVYQYNCDTDKIVAWRIPYKSKNDLWFM